MTASTTSPDAQDEACEDANAAPLLPADAVLMSVSVSGTGLHTHNCPVSE